MNPPVDGNNLPAEPGRRIIDQAELPAQGVTDGLRVLIADSGFAVRT